MNPIYDSRYAQNLHTRLVDELSKVHRDLGSGGQIIRDDAAASGMNCAKFIGRIEGLKLALTCMEQVDKEMNGKSKKESNG